MTFNSDTIIEPCDEPTDLPTMTFDFIKINELESKQPNSMIGKFCGSSVGLCNTVGSMSDCRSRGPEFEPQSGYITFVEIDHEIISVAILPLTTIQEG